MVPFEVYDTIVADNQIDNVAHSALGSVGTRDESRCTCPSQAKSNRVSLFANLEGPRVD
jgi:hypothetical protein